MNNIYIIATLATKKKKLSKAPSHLATTHKLSITDNVSNFVVSVNKVLD